MTNDDDSDSVEKVGTLTPQELRAYLPPPVKIPAQVLESLVTERVLTLAGPGGTHRLRMVVPKAWTPTANGFVIPSLEGRTPGALTFEVIGGGNRASKSEPQEYGRRLIADAAAQSLGTVEHIDVPDGQMLVTRRSPHEDQDGLVHQSTSVVAFRVPPDSDRLIVLRATVPADPLAFYEPLVRHVAKTYEVLR